MSSSSKETAIAVLEVVPLVMRNVRLEIQRNPTLGLSVPQFRTLKYIDRHTGASLSDVAEHIGLTLPSMSKLIDGLVARQWVTRKTHAGDRRRMTLSLSAEGRALLKLAHTCTQVGLAQKLETLSANDRAAVARAMRILHPLFSPVSE